MTTHVLFIIHFYAQHFSVAIYGNTNLKWLKSLYFFQYKYLFKYWFPPKKRHFSITIQGNTVLKRLKSLYCFQRKYWFPKTHKWICQNGDAILRNGWALLNGCRIWWITVEMKICNDYDSERYSSFANRLFIIFRVKIFIDKLFHHWVEDKWWWLSAWLWHLHC